MELLGFERGATTIEKTIMSGNIRFESVGIILVLVFKARQG